MLAPFRCLTPDLVNAYAAGALARAELSVVGIHIDRCASCRRLVSCAAEMASGVSGAGETGRADRDPPFAGDRLSPGAVVGRYVIDATVGSGGMGVVYAAHDPELGRKIALKVLRVGLLPGDRFAEDLLRREAMAMARIAHPNVVGVHDLFVANGTMFVAMELIEGRTLRAWLREARRSWREVLSLMVLAGRGLAAAHAQGVVHRDFKPDNVLVGTSGRVCVLDFGLSSLGSSTAPQPAVEAAPKVSAGPAPTDGDGPRRNSALHGPRATARRGGDGKGRPVQLLHRLVRGLVRRAPLRRGARAARARRLRSAYDSARACQVQGPGMGPSRPSSRPSSGAGGSISRHEGPPRRPHEGVLGDSTVGWLQRWSPRWGSRP